MNEPNDAMDALFEEEADPSWRPFHVNSNIGALHVDDWHPEIVDVVRNHRLSHIQLSGWDQPDLTPLLPLRDQILGFSFSYLPNRPDFSLLSEFSRLQTLHILEGIREIDFSRLMELTSFAISSSARGFGNLDAASVLEDIHITDCGLRDLTPLTGVSNLKRLSVGEAPLRSLAGIEHFARLEQIVMHQVPIASLDGLQTATQVSSISLGFVRRLESIAELTLLPRLTHLSITPPKTLRDLARIGELTQLEELEIDHGLIGDSNWLAPLVNLRKLRLEDVRTIASLQFMERMLELEDFYCAGDVTIADGDLSVLLRLPKLEKVFCRSRRHYAPSGEDVRAAIMSRARA
jgi:hypothetical protein